MDLPEIHAGDAIRLDPLSSASFNNRGALWAEMKQVDKARMDYSEAIRLDPRCFAAFINRANLFVETGEVDNALADFTEAIRLNGNDAPAYSGRADLWFERDQLDKAIEDYSAVVRLEPTSVFAYYRRGCLHRLKEQYDAALKDLSEVVRLDPLNPAAHGERAWIWATATDAKVRNGKLAVEAAARSCVLSDWKEPDFMEALAAAHAESGDFEEAVKIEAKAIELMRDGTSDADELSQAETRLDYYKSGKTYRG